MKISDKVRVINTLKDHYNCIGKIIDIRQDNPAIKVRFEDNEEYWYDAIELELISKYKRTPKKGKPDWLDLNYKNECWVSDNYKNPKKGGIVETIVNYNSDSEYPFIDDDVDAWKYATPIPDEPEPTIEIKINSSESYNATPELAEKIKKMLEGEG